MHTYTFSEIAESFNGIDQLPHSLQFIVSCIKDVASFLFFSFHFQTTRHLTALPEGATGPSSRWENLIVDYVSDNEPLWVSLCLFMNALFT